MSVGFEPRMRLEKQKEDLWGNVALAHCVTDEIHSARHVNQGISVEQRNILRSAALAVERSEKDLSVKRFFAILDALESMDTPTRLLEDQLQEYAPDLSIGTFHLQKPVPTLFQGPSSIRKKNIRALQKWMRQSDRSLLFSTSDSHVTTAYTIEAAQQEGWSSGEAAVLVFDHHNDTMTMPFAKKVEEAPNKVNLFKYLIEHNCISDVAIFGSSAQKDFGRVGEVYRGEDLYKNETPSLEKFRSALHHQFDLWKRKGIREIYPSVDLDVLRMPEYQYTGTDYNHVTKMLRVYLESQLSGGQSKLLYQVIQGKGEQQNKARKRFREWMEFLIKPYYGLPVSWIISALRYAKEEGFEIGLSHPRTGRKIAGDVVEYYDALDTNRRTGKVATRLIYDILHCASNVSTEINL